MFYDILERKNAFQGYKNKKLKSRKIEIFPEGLVHRFSPKWTFFHLFLFMLPRLGDCVFFSGETHTTRNRCLLRGRTHSSTDMCFLGGGTHIGRDMCFPVGGTISLGMCVFLLGEHISLGTCVSCVGKHYH